MAVSEKSKAFAHKIPFNLKLCQLLSSSEFIKLMSIWLYLQGFNYRNRISVILESISQGWNFSFQLLLSTKARELPGITNPCRIKLEAISFISVIPLSKLTGQYMRYCNFTPVSLFLWLMKSPDIKARL